VFFYTKTTFKATTQIRDHGFFKIELHVDSIVLVKNLIDNKGVFDAGSQNQGLSAIYLQEKM
jgi:hypothetical protein